MLWDWHGYPMPLVPAWNMLCHHIGLSERVGFIRPEGASFCIFEDLRNRRGMMIAYADREAKVDVTVELPFSGLIAEDAMGNAAPLPGRTLTLSRTGRPVFLYAADATRGKAFAEKLAPLGRKHASFVSQGGAGKNFRLPPVWEGTRRDASDGNPAVADGRPIWRLDQVWPPDPTQPANYIPLAWRDGWWLPLRNTFGGQPKIEFRDGAIRIEFRARHGQPPADRLCGLVFIAPQAGAFRVAGSAELKLWDGNNPVRLSILHKTKDAVTEAVSLPLTRNQRVLLAEVRVALAAGDELVFLPRPDGMFTGGDVTLRDLEVGLGAGGGTTYRLPRAWEGVARGTAQGNPIVADGRPVWRLDQVWPDDPTIAANYTPLPWNGTSWHASQHEHGGQPDARVENGAFLAAVRGSWTGQPGQKIAGLVFIAPRSGNYTVTGLARSKPWEGGAKVFRLGVFKKDTQRAAQVSLLELPRDGSPVPFRLTVELTAGHELVFLPLMPDWHNATTTSIENLAVSLEP